MHIDVNKDVKSYWVLNDIIVEDIGVTFRVGHIIRAIQTIAINHDNDAQEKIGAFNCLFLLANNRERNDTVLKRMLSSADLLKHLKKLVHANNIRNIDDVPTLVVAVGIGARVWDRDDDKEEMPTMTDAMARNYSSTLSRVSSPKLMKKKSSSKIERQATRSHNQYNQDLFRKLYFSEDSPFQYLFSREMEVDILNQMETDKSYRSLIASAVRIEIWRSLCLKFVNDNKNLKKNNIHHDGITKYLPVTDTNNKARTPKLIKKVGGNGNDSNGNNRTDGISIILEKHTNDLQQMF